MRQYEGGTRQQYEEGTRQQYEEGTRQQYEEGTGGHKTSKDGATETPWMREGRKRNN